MKRIGARADRIRPGRGFVACCANKRVNPTPCGAGALRAVHSWGAGYAQHVRPTGRRFVRSLELRVPPDVVALLVVGVMWVLSRLGAAISLAPVLRYLLGMAFVLAGLAVVFAAREAFARHDTSWGPLAPSHASALVIDGIYGLSRNPMYLGTWLFLVGVGVMMGSYFSAIGSLLYSVYVDRFQIAPEERALATKFREDFESYRRKVRRWV